MVSVCSTVGVRIGGTLGDTDPVKKVFLREPEAGFSRVPFKGSPYCYLGYSSRLVVFILLIKGL